MVNTRGKHDTVTRTAKVKYIPTKKNTRIVQQVRTPGNANIHWPQMSAYQHLTKGKYHNWTLSTLLIQLNLTQTCNHGEQSISKLCSLIRLSIFKRKFWPN